MDNTFSPYNEIVGMLPSFGPNSLALVSWVVS